jgi:hypothetical protein
LAERFSKREAAKYRRALSTPEGRRFALAARGGLTPYARRQAAEAEAMFQFATGGRAGAAQIVGNVIEQRRRQAMAPVRRWAFR